MIRKYYSFINESDNNGKPQLKFPTDKAAHYNYLLFIIEKAGLDPYRLFKKEKGGDVAFQDFCFEKCNSPILFPLNREIDINHSGRIRYTKFIFPDSVFLLPAVYDSTNDYADSIEKKISFLKRMTDMMKKTGATKEDLEDFEKQVDTHVNFGVSDYSRVNKALEIIHKEFEDYYVNGKLRVYFPEDLDDDGYADFDYPHKCIFRHYERQNGVVFLSELEKWLWDKFGLQDDLLYQFVIYNQYVEGRYWERIWDFNVEENNKHKLKRQGFGKYGMKPTKTISQMLNIIEENFEINGNEYKGFPIFVDYYKKIKSKY